MEVLRNHRETTIWGSGWPHAHWCCRTTSPNALGASLALIRPSVWKRWCGKVIRFDLEASWMLFLSDSQELSFFSPVATCFCHFSKSCEGQETPYLHWWPLHAQDWPLWYTTAIGVAEILDGKSLGIDEDLFVSKHEPSLRLLFAIFYKEFMLLQLGMFMYERGGDLDKIIIQDCCPFVAGGRFVDVRWNGLNGVVFDSLRLCSTMSLRCFIGVSRTIWILVSSSRAASTSPP